MGEQFGRNWRASFTVGGKALDPSSLRMREAVVAEVQGSHITLDIKVSK